MLFFVGALLAAPGAPETGFVGALLAAPLQDKSLPEKCYRCSDVTT